MTVSHDNLNEDDDDEDDDDDDDDDHKLWVKYSAESEPAWTKSTHSYFPVIPAHNVYHQDQGDVNLVMMMLMMLVLM